MTQGSDKRFCSQCGAQHAAGDRFCSSCGHQFSGGKGQARARAREAPAPAEDKHWTAYLPWVLSGLALVAFAVAITLFIQGQAAPRIGDMGMTGGVIEGNPETPAAGGATGAQGAMPSADQIANMSPREAADRLFNRAMTMRETGDPEQAKFFANMAVQAYGMVPPAERDFDVRFHVGLLYLTQDDAPSAFAAADTILAADPDHLLALALVARAAAVEGDAARERDAYERYLDALPAGLTAGLPEYAEHDRYLEIEAERAREVTGR